MLCYVFGWDVTWALISLCLDKGKIEGKWVGFKPFFESIWSWGVIIYKKEGTEKLNPKNLVLVHQIRALRIKKKKKKKKTTQETQLNHSNPKGHVILWPPRWSNVGMRGLIYIYIYIYIYIFEQKISNILIKKLKQI